MILFGAFGQGCRAFGGGGEWETHGGASLRAVYAGNLTVCAEKITVRSFWGNGGGILFVTVIKGCSFNLVY